MAEPVWKQRLRAAVENDSRGMKGVSLASGQGETFVRDILKRDRAPTIDKLIALADTLGTSVAELITEEEPKNKPPQQPDIIQVPLLSWVSAGPLADPQAQVSTQESERQLFFADLGAGDFFALEVNGDSMNRVSPSGSIIVVNRADRELVANRCYVFMKRGETTYKRWEPHPARLEPWSTNDAHKPQYIRGKRDFSVVGRVRRTVLDL